MEDYQTYSTICCRGRLAAVCNRKYTVIVESAISELDSQFAVVEVPLIPHVVNPLSVSVQSSGKKRLILDLRHVNKCVWKQNIKFEDWRLLTSYVSKDGFC